MNLELSGVVSVLAAAASLLLMAHVLRAVGRQRDFTQQILRYFGWTLAALGVLGFCMAMIGPVGFVLWGIVMAFWVRLAFRYRAMQKWNLLMLIALAVDKKMPLGPLARALAEEQEGGFGRRAEAVAGNLEAGASFYEAYRQTPRALPRETALVGRVGTKTGDLSGALRAVISSSKYDRTVLPPVIWRLFYVIPVMFFFLSFMWIRILPEFVKIFDDFGTDLPPVTIAVMRVLPNRSLAATLDTIISPFLPGYGAIWLVQPMTWILATMLYFSAMLALWIWLQWRGTLQPRLPVVKRVINWIDMGPVLRVLALGVEHNQPLSTMINALAASHSKRSVRTRIRRVSRDLDNGLPWSDGLRRQGLLKRVDVAVLSAAGRNGNLCWALREMADSFERRANYRLRGITQVALPLLLLPVGAVVAVISMAYFYPLCVLIERLSV